MTKVTASFEFSGFGGYWGGNGRRWDDNAGCLFASYDHKTTLRELIDDLVNDFEWGGDCDSFPEDISGDDVRTALMDMLTDAGRADYESGAVCEFAKDLADANGLSDDDDLEDWGELPQVIVLLECEVPEDCEV